jgi:hypothetical protein
MHRAWASAASLWLAEIGGGGLPPDRSCLQELAAAWNAGDCSLTVGGTMMPSKEFEEPVALPPLAPGSGKFGMPCERIHSEKSSFALYPLVLAAVALPLDLRLEDPQAANAAHSAQARQEQTMRLVTSVYSRCRNCR